MTKKKAVEVSREPIAGAWRGVPTWQCPFCERDGTNEAAVREHIDQYHPAFVPHPLAAIAAQENADGTATTDQEQLQRAVSDGGGDADGNG